MNKKYEIWSKNIEDAFNSGEILDILDRVASKRSIEKTGTFEKDLISASYESLLDFRPDFSILDETSHTVYKKAYKPNKSRALCNKPTSKQYHKSNINKIPIVKLVEI
ncbi:hypothetical protein [Anaerococcus lactolyticus]|uniref:Uncharacterized protein n=1 Tax=Anaerococcus lactolyticus S7-1-13 TaxID=1284686 RepID=A0A095Z4L1_9FIRM|nr:hypothetical protein [Anaerococcus lactolyticus]KGF03409.1 hypothetical protein HMPREF1630_07460 [Anaerococcus lactolyticus S7-1-13]